MVPTGLSANLLPATAQVYSALDDIVGTLSESDKAQIFGGTAQQFYGLS